MSGLLKKPQFFLIRPIRHQARNKSSLVIPVAIDIPSRSSLPSLLRYFKIEIFQNLKGFSAFRWKRPPLESLSCQTFPCIFSRVSFWRSPDKEHILQYKGGNMWRNFSTINMFRKSKTSIWGPVASCCRSRGKLLWHCHGHGSIPFCGQHEPWKQNRSMDTFILPSKSPGLGHATSLSSISTLDSTNIVLLGGDDLLPVHVHELLPAHPIQLCCSEICSGKHLLLEASTRFISWWWRWRRTWSGRGVFIQPWGQRWCHPCLLHHFGRRDLSGRGITKMPKCLQAGNSTQLNDKVDEDW